MVNEISLFSYVDGNHLSALECNFQWTCCKKFADYAFNKKEFFENESSSKLKSSETYY